MPAVHQDFRIPVSQLQTQIEQRRSSQKVKINFTHRQSAHCESGVTANLLCHHGHPLSEAMAFGIGGGLFFGYFPFVRVNHLPLVTFRCAPGAIFKNCARRLGLQIDTRVFRHPDRAMRALDASLAEATPVGLQTGVYWLPYFPPALRFHFNAHNLVVCGREGDNYLISDPVFDCLVSCSRSDLQRARFAKGALSPRGRMYRLVGSPDQVDLAGAAIKGIREVCQRMVAAPFPLIGVKGIRFLSRRLARWEDRLGRKGTMQHLGHLIRMQEEVGTGGGGFRFIYAAFLQEAAELLGSSHLAELAERLTGIGDQWRRFALFCSRNCKDRHAEEWTCATLAKQLSECADREEALFRDLRRHIH